MVLPYRPTPTGRRALDQLRRARAWLAISGDLPGEPTTPTAPVSLGFSTEDGDLVVTEA